MPTQLMTAAMDLITTGRLLVLACAAILWFQYKAAQGWQREHLVAEASREGKERTLPNRPPIEVLYPGPTDPATGGVEVDIVAVHGLGSNVDWSWTWKDGAKRVHWLRDPDMLPAKVPNARIMVYNYDSTWHSNAPKTRLHLCGKDLVDSLHDFRADVSDRPIIFVGHSLGGLVIQYGLLLADADEKFKYLPRHTVGFVALGTPFRGTKMQSIADIIARFAVLAGSHQGIIRDLVYGDTILGDQLEALCRLRDTLSIPTCCFFELYMTDYGKRFGLPGYIKGMVVGEESACIDGWPKKPLQTDHLKMNKYSSPDDRSFGRVSEEIKIMYADAKNLLERRKTVTQVRHFLVPFGRNKAFVGRESVLHNIFKIIPPGADKDDCQRTAIEGLGGVGKTQVALEAAYRIYDEYPNCSVFWVPAIDATSFENAYREIGHQLGVEGIEKDKADVKLLVRSALGHERAGSWLLIIDNADDLDLLFTDAKLADYLPFSRKGSIVFTTRNHETTVRLDIPQTTNIITIAEMSDDEAIELLQKGLKENQKCDMESTARLLELLANLPLAIKQASAYMASNTSVTVSQYLELYLSSNSDMIEFLSRHFEDRFRYKDLSKQRNPITTTWLISFEHISRHNSLATDCLKSMCFLAEKDIPLSLLPEARKVKMAEAIGTLIGYAFIMERERPDSFDIHRLVRLAMRNWLQENGQWQDWATNTIQQLSRSFPFPKHENREVWMRYLPHGQAALEFQDECTNDEAKCMLLFNVGGSKLVLGKYVDAEQMYRQTLELGKKVGRENRNTLSSMNNLANVLENQGKYEEAMQMHRQVLELKKKVLGRNHPDTLASRNNFANILTRQGKYEEAKQIYWQILEIREEVLGKEYPDTLTSMNNLALVLGSQGKYEEAEQIHRQTLKLREKVLNKEHPSTLDSMNNLASVLGGQGKHEEAEQIYRQTLELREKVLGREHHYTLASMSNLAVVICNQGKYAEAKQLHSQTLEIRKKTLGKEHPDTFISMNNLAVVFYSQGEYEEAEEMYRQTLELREKILGKDHPSTVQSRKNLEQCLQDRRKRER
ncbi:hypothetical protein F5X99DRAFT_342248 [Biscogniauxia marginata]|nr:hypothetical protein F5X99DRAFT_342248 [Biscogniauxia marginata]